MGRGSTKVDSANSFVILQNNSDYVKNVLPSVTARIQQCVWSTKYLSRQHLPCWPSVAGLQGITSGLKRVLMLNPFPAYRSSPVVVVFHLGFGISSALVLGDYPDQFQSQVSWCLAQPLPRAL